MNIFLSFWAKKFTDWRSIKSRPNFFLKLIIDKGLTFHITLKVRLYLAEADPTDPYLFPFYFTNSLNQAIGSSTCGKLPSPFRLDSSW